MNKGQFRKIRGSTDKLIKEWDFPQRQLVLLGSSVLLIILVFIFGYRPLLGKLKDADNQLKGLSVQLSSRRSQISILKKIDLTDRLMPQKEVSRAIDDITEKGRALGLKFVAITPQAVQKSAQGGFKEIPIDFKIESAYKGLGQFLAYLEEFPRCLAQVKDLSIRSQEKTPTQLNIELLLNLYLEE